jgi:hypothetical protein
MVHHRSRIRRRGARARSGMLNNGSGWRRKVRHCGAGHQQRLRTGCLTV